MCFLSRVHPLCVDGYHIVIILRLSDNITTADHNIKGHDTMAAILKYYPTLNMMKILLLKNQINRVGITIL